MRKILAIVGILMLVTMGILWATGVFDDEILIENTDRVIISGSLDYVIVCVLLPLFPLSLVLILYLPAGLFRSVGRKKRATILRQKRMMKESLSIKENIEESIMKWQKFQAKMEKIERKMFL